MITGAAIGFILWSLLILITIIDSSKVFDYPKVLLMFLVLIGSGGSIGYLFS